MLSDPVRLKSLLLHPTRPIQLVIAGKSHPADEGGKKLIQELVRFSDDPEVRHRIVFLPDYDMGMASWLYPGCDVWLNNPLRPLEACGTSGMKAALNGALNLSILDGWWTSGTTRRMVGQFQQLMASLIRIDGMILRPMRFKISSKKMSPRFTTTNRMGCQHVGLNL